MRTSINPSLLANGSFTSAELDAFRRCYREQYGITLTDDQVARYARAVTGYVALVCRVVEPPAPSAASTPDNETLVREGLDEVAPEFN